MTRRLPKLLTKSLLAAALVCTWSTSSAQCANTTDFGSATVDPGGAVTTISTCNFDGEYSTVSGVVASADYEFVHSIGGYVTVYSGSATGTLEGHGLSPLTITTSAPGDLFVHWNADAACATGASCVTTTAQLLLSCTAPSAAATITDDCPNNQFSINVDITALGSAATVGIEYSVNAGTPATISGLGTGITPIGPFAINDNVEVTVLHDADVLCNLALGTLSDNNTCPTSVVCGAGAVNTTHCYTSNDNSSFVYASDNGDPIKLTFNAGGLESCCDNIDVYDGNSNAAPSLYSGNNGGDLTGLTFTSTGGFITIEVDADGSVDCGSSSSCCATQWDWDAECFLCSPPSATAIATDNCPSNQFSITVDLTGLGDATTLDISENVNAGGASTVYTGVSALTQYVLGPYSINDVVDVMVIHDNDASCDLSFAGLTDNNTCPTVVSCGTAQNYTHCYDSNDGTNWKWTSSTGGILSLTFNAGQLESCCDDINIYDGLNNSATLLYSGNNGGDLTGLNISSTGPNLYFEIDADGSVDCASGSTCCATQWDWDIECFLCTQPTATAALVADCDNSQYSIDVNLTSLGSATDVDITEDVNGGGVNVVHSAANASGNYALGPYSASDVVVVAVVHNQDNTCSIFLGSVGPANCAAQSTCALGLAIPDNACPTTEDFIVPTTAGGTQLGTDIFLSSVDLVISHTYNADLEVSLISPNGVTVSLVADRFGGGDNLGDPTNCPTDVITFLAGGAAMTTSATSNVTGLYAPEAPLSGFNDGSDPNGSWVLAVCDDAGGDTGELEYIQLNFVTCESPTAVGTLSLDCGNGQFFVDVNISALGTATDVDIVSDLNGVEQAAINATGSYSVGPYTSGATVNLSVAHNQDNACDITLGAFSFTCPPVNDTCASAIPVVCNTLVSGNTSTGATTIDAPATCITSLNTAPGLWYSAVGTGGEMFASLCFAPFDTKIGVFEGTCGALVCVTGEDDDFSSCGGNDPSVNWTSTAGTVYYIYVTGFSSNTGSFDLQVACQGSTPPCTNNNVSLEIQTDGNASQNRWEILANGLSVPVCEGAGLVNNALITVSCCLLDGCYTLRVFDSFGDGMTTGGYVLRDGNGERIIDNAGDGQFGSLSAINNGGLFCLPIGQDKLEFAFCDNEQLLANDFIVAETNPAVAAQYGVGAQNDDGYQFWIFDPDGTYGRFIFLSYQKSSYGAPPGVGYPNHLNLVSLATNPPPANVLLNVRIRSRVNGVNSAFGPACRIKIDPTAAACPSTQLINDPNNQFFSCGVTKNYGGSDKITAVPLQGANKYRFKFEIPSEGFVRNIAVNQYTLTLNWGPNIPLSAGKTYDVTVRASFDNGANYCPFGPSCTVTIASSPFAEANNDRSIADVDSDLVGSMIFWPNPNRGDVLNLILNDIDENVDMATIQLFDGFGKVVYTSSLPVIGGEVNGQVDLNAGLAKGMYLLHATAGDARFVERLIIQ